MALGLLMIMFVAMSVISIGGVILLFLLRNEKVKKGIYYFMTAWAMFVAIYWIYRCAESACPVFWKSPVRKEEITVPDR